MTVAARAHVNPSDPLRARATLLLGSARFRASKTLFIPTAQRERACGTETVGTGCRLSGFSGSVSRGMDSKREGGAVCSLAQLSRASTPPSSGGIQPFQFSGMNGASCSLDTVRLIPPLSGVRTAAASRSCSSELLNDSDQHLFLSSKDARQ